MISKDKDVDVKDLVVIEGNRPTLLHDYPDMIAYWKRFHDIVKNSDIEVWVNNVFWMIDDVLENDGEYMGGGFRYCFWVRTQEDKDKILALAKGEIED